MISIIKDRVFTHICVYSRSLEDLCEEPVGVPSVFVYVDGEFMWRGHANSLRGNIHRYIGEEE